MTSPICVCCTIMNCLHLVSFLRFQMNSKFNFCSRRVTKSIFAQKFTLLRHKSVLVPLSMRHCPTHLPATCRHFTCIYAIYISHSTPFNFRIHFAIHVDRQNRQNRHNRRETGPHVLLARVQIQKKGAEK